MTRRRIGLPAVGAWGERQVSRLEGQPRLSRVELAIGFAWFAFLIIIGILWWWIPLFVFSALFVGYWLLLFAFGVRYALGKRRGRRRDGGSKRRTSNGA